MSVKVYFINGESAWYPKGKTFGGCPEEPNGDYEVVGPDDKRIARIPRANVLRADILPDEE